MMNKPLLKTRYIEVGGWLAGLITATLCDYFVVPAVSNMTGLRLIAIVVGLVIGLFLMFVCVTAAQHLKDVLRKRYGTQEPVRSEADKRTRNRSDGSLKKSKYSRRLSFPMLSSLLVLALLGSYLTDIMLAGKSAQISPLFIIGLIIGAITIIFSITIVSQRVAQFFDKRYRISSLEKQRSFRRLLYSCFLIAPLVLIGIFTFYAEVLKPLQPVAQVSLEDGSLRKITAREFLHRLRYEREKQMKKAPSADKSEYQLGFAGTVLDRMTREILVREQAEKRNLTVSEEEIDQQIGKAEPASKTQSGKQQSIPQYGLTKEQFREVYRLELLGQKLREAFYRDIPIEQEQVRLKLIRFESEEAARQAVPPTWGDTSFSKIYDEITEGSAKNAAGMFRDWSSAAELEHDYSPDFSKLAFQTTVGGCFPQPVPAARGWYLAEVLGHEKRKMTEEWRKQKGDDAFQNWLDNQQARITQFPDWMKLVPVLPGSAAPVANAQIANEKEMKLK